QTSSVSILARSVIVISCQRGAACNAAIAAVRSRMPVRGNAIRQEVSSLRPASATPASQNSRSSRQSSSAIANPLHPDRADFPATAFQQAQHALFAGQMQGAETGDDALALFGGCRRGLFKRFNPAGVA